MQYFFFFIVTVLALLLFGSWIKSSRVSFNRVSLVMIIMVISGYWGITYLDTVDMPGYYEMYSLLEKGVNPNSTLFGYSYNRFEPAFIYLMQLCKNVGLPFWGFQLCLLFFEVSLLGIGFYRLLNDDWLLACFLVSISLYLPFWLMAAMRQGIPIAVFLFVLPDIVEGNYKKPIILVLLASLFHSSGVFLVLLILLFILYKRVTTRLLNNGIAFFVVLLVLCDTIYILGLSMSDMLNRFAMLLFSDNPFIYRDYTIMSIEGESDYGILKLLEMNFLYLFTFLVGNRIQNRRLLFLEFLFLLYFFINTVAGGIIVHRLSYYLIIPYYLLFFVVLTRLFSSLRAKEMGIFVFIVYMFMLFIRQYHAFSSYDFEYFMP